MVKKLGLFLLLLTAPAFSQGVGGRGVPGPGGAVNCAGVPGGTSTTGCGGVPGGPSGPLLTATVTSGTTNPGTSVRYNDQFAGQNGLPNNGRSTNGDTRSYTVTGGGALVQTANDGSGGQGLTNGRNVFVQSASSDFLTETTLNSFDDYGTEDCTYNGTAGSTTCTNVAGSWADGYNWKSTGIWSDHGKLFGSVYRQQNGVPYAGTNASIIMSTDGGNTWCNYTHVVSQACSGNSSVSGQSADVPQNGQSMWPNSSTIRGPIEVWYCQDNSISCPSVDSNSTYAYLISNNSALNAFYLLRVPLNEIADLNVSEYQYWTGSAWSSTLASAAPIITFSHGGISKVIYDSSLARYVMVGWEFQENQALGGFTSEIVIATAATITGPWTKTVVVPTNDEYLAYFEVQPQTKSFSGCSTYKLTSTGDFSYNLFTAPTPLQVNYSTHIQSLRLCPSGSLPAPSRISPVTAGLVQEFTFTPTPATTIYDSSGNANNGFGYSTQNTANYAGVYTSQGLNGFNGSLRQNDFRVDTGQNYTGTDLTATVIFQHQGPANYNFGYEKILWNQVSDSAAGSLEIQRDSTNADVFQVAVDGSKTASDITLSDNSWQEVIIRRTGATVNVYDANSFNGSTATPIATFTSNTRAMAGEILLGSGAGSSADLQGKVGYYSLHSRSLSTVELVAHQAAINAAMQARAVYLAQPITGAVLDSQAALGAWGLRQLRTAYSGAAVNIKRASDSTSTDIGFDGSGNFNSAAATTFCSGTTCSVNTIYDQSGNGYNETCTGSPLIYTGGAIPTSGGKPAISFNATNYCTTGSSFYYLGIYGTAEAVANVNASAPGYSIIQGWFSAGVAAYTNPQSADALQIIGTTADVRWARNSVGSSGLAITFGAPSVMASIFGDFFWRSYVDGNVASVVTSGSGTPPQRFYLNTIGIGTDSNSAQYFYGLISEEIMFPYAISSEAYANLRANQKAYYGTP